MPIYATMIDTAPPCSTIPPLSITIPSNGHKNNNQSGLTGLCDDGDDDNSHHDSDIAVIGTTTNMKENKQKKDHIELQQQVIQQKKLLVEKQELLCLRLQITKQKKMLNLLSCKLTKSQIENETLKVEKASLIDELSLARDAIERDVNANVEEQSTSLHGRFSLRGGGTNNNNGESSLQILLDRNARLLADNAHLQLSQDGIRKSLQSHIKFTQAISRADKEVIADLQRENDALRQIMQQQQRKHNDSADNSVKDSESSEVTSKTSLASHYTSGENEEKRKSNTTDKCIKAVHEDTKENEVDNQNRVVGRAAPHRTSESEKLLVDFGESQRLQSAVRKWCSLKNVTK
mmetsp:Transcript_10586/g.23108  ORF Transcript_10586/g.23108 Transcript_10586/m.23108 type:complete len:347 (-) Transcript_10586:158-1198(-)